jgi:putative serine protease PepD
MTAGYDPSNPAVPGAPGASGVPGPLDQPRHAAAEEGEPERLGPLPPRMHSTGSFPTVGSPFQSPPTGPIPAVPVSTAPPPTSGGFPTAGFPAQPTSPYATGPLPVSGPVGGYAPPPPPPRRSRLASVAFFLAALLLVVAAAEGYLIYRLNQQVADANADAAKAREANNVRFEGLEGRAKELEKKAGANLDASDVAAGVLPSVFRVTTPEALGTAFALGKAPAGGGTDMITNYHVVEDFYKRGGRDVSIERRDQRFTAKIVKVEPGKDLALLHSDEEFPRLAAATTIPSVGQPVLAVGAPLGLEGSATVGVISALRSTSNGQRLQFDAPINPGNSGGPVVNAQKQVVGIATAKAAEAEGIGLAIPIAVACDSFGIC